ncbi:MULTISPECIES: hypothetical protein [Sphingobium]|jgi:hypothetical protein|uniref:Uncharacterized protein n=1 Tax=Sphingobium lactosutens DS20 TaxID=1331060 RepID=T0HX97_9SPHN|nr:hypothetical protein [Sphingobium fuliginis]EQB16733.1 hypothetical protein RLDS_06345 [Sphingobium lactosutens DS20]
MIGSKSGEKRSSLQCDRIRLAQVRHTVFRRSEAEMARMDRFLTEGGKTGYLMPPSGRCYIR